MQIGLCTISNKDADIETVLEQAAGAGYDGVEIWGKNHIGDGSPETCRTIAGHATELGLEIFVYGSYLRPGTESYDDSVEHELAVADRLGADRIRIWAGCQEYEDCTEDHWEAVITDLRDLTERAAKTDVTVTVERHAGTVTNTTEGAQRVIETVDDDRCRLNYQPIFTASEADLIEDARKLAPLSNNVHVQAVPERGADDRCLLTEAYFDVGAVLGPFLEGGIDGAINVEFVPTDRPYAEAIVANRQYLESLDA